MKRALVSLTFSMFALFGIALDTQAHGLFRGHRGCDDCAAPCAAPCEAAPVKYEERTVTRYKQVMVEKEIEEIVCKRVMREEKFTYNVCVPVTRPEKRMVTVCTPVMKDVPYEYTVCSTVMVPEKRMQTCYNRVEKEVSYQYTVMHRETVQKPVKAVRYECVTEMVKEVRQVCKLVPVTYTDECGRCCTRCERVMENVECTRPVTKRVAVPYDTVVCEVICKPEVRTGKKIVCELVPVSKEVVVNVCKIVTEKKTGVKKVCEIVNSTKEEVVNVCTYETQKKEGVRQVCDIVKEKVKRKVQVCTMQPYEEKIRVAVGGACSTCDTGCAPRHCGGLFRRGHCCN